MATQWFCRLMGSELGPYSASQMVDLVRKSRLTPEDLIRKGPTGEWVPAYRVKGLFEAAQRPAPTRVASRAASADTSDQAGTATRRDRADTPSTTSLSGLLVSAILGDRSKKGEAGHGDDQAASHDTASHEGPSGEPGTLAATRSRQWYCIVGGQRHGPMTMDALQRIAANGKLKPSDRVWSSTCPKWSRAQEVPELSSMVAGR